MSDSVNYPSILVAILVELEGQAWAAAKARSANVIAKSAGPTLGVDATKCCAALRCLRSRLQVAKQPPLWPLA